MSFVHGKGTTVLLGVVDLSPYLNSIDVGADFDMADTTVFKSTWKSAIQGTGGGTVSIAGLYDPAESSLPALLTSAVPGYLTYCPGAGGAVGDAARMVSAIETAYSESAPVGGVVALSGSFQADGAIGFGYLLHPLSEDTNNTTGATRNDGAATSTGWTMHLHVTAVDGGTWVVTLADASASNFSDAAIVTGGEFTGITVPTSRRLVGAAGATVRRYVHYTAIRTGGSAGDGITFALAFARN